MYSQFSDLLPQSHPYVEAYNHHKGLFGGAANVLTMVLQVKDGDIFTKRTLEQVKLLTEEMALITGVDHNQIASIYHVKIRNLKTAPGGIIRSVPVLPAEIPSDPAALNRLRMEMFNNDIVYNQYISGDGKAALIRAGFNEERLDYREIYRQVTALKTAVEDENTVLYVAGEPMLKGWVWRFTDELFFIFALTGVMIVGALYVYFRRAYGTLVPLVGALIQGIWGLGWIGWWQTNLDPLILVVPVLVTARAISHGVQLVERYFEVLAVEKNQERAAFKCMNDLFLPGVTSVISDTGGILVLSVATIPLIQNLAFFSGGFWAFANLFCLTHLMPIILSYLPAPRDTEHTVPSWAGTVSRWIGTWTTSRSGSLTIVSVAGVLIVFGLQTAVNVPIGEQESGSPLLWADSHYNVSVRQINDKFAGSAQLVIYLEGTRDHVLKEPQVIGMLEEMRRYMLEQPEAGGTRELATLLKSINRLWHYNHPFWQIVPPDRAGAANFLLVYEMGAPNSGAILEYTDRMFRNGQFVVFYKDASGPTVREAVARAKKFIAEHPIPEVDFRLAGGLIGTTAALNEEIDRSEKKAAVLVILTIYVLVLLSYGSFAAANMVLIALVAAGVASYMYISFMGIGLHINSLPVTAVGMGIGVDYILYVVDRIRREVPRAGGDVVTGIMNSISTTGMAVTLTGVTMIFGILPWYFLSSLRFSAEMALLLAILMITHWLSAVLLTPAMFVIFRPSFAQSRVQKSKEVT